MALSQFCFWNCNCLWNLPTIVACHAQTISLLHGWESFSEWVSNGHWLKLSSDLIFSWCFNIYLFGCYLSVVEVTLRNGEVLKDFLWTTFIWIFLDSHRKPQQIGIQTRVLTANDLLKITMVCHHMVFNQISNLVSFTVHMCIE